VAHVIETPRIEHGERLSHVDIRRPQPEHAVRGGEFLDGQRTDFIDTHVRIRTPATVRNVIGATVVTPRHIGDDDPERPGREWWRFGSNVFRLPALFQLLVSAVDVPRAIHLVEQAIIFLRFTFRSFNNGSGFFQRPP
jgi:hypothetical protein